MQTPGRSIQAKLGGSPVEKGESKVRLIKMFGLAALAAVAAMAFVGATSAMAENTTLCESDTAELGCATGTEASHVHFATLSGSPALLLSSVVNVKCDALYLGDSLGLASPLVLHGSFTYSNCETFNSGECKSVVQTSASALISVLKTAVELGEVTGEAEVLVECVGIHCKYNGVGLKGHAEGSLGSGHTVITKQTVNKVSGFLCPKTATLDITTGSLTSLYIRN
jgi:hypothetical protein